MACSPPMPSIRVKVDVSGPLRLVAKELPNAVPYVKATLLTNIANRIRQDTQQALPVKFDRPTPFTVRGVWVKAATKINSVAEVYFPESRDEIGRGKREYIRPGALGAARRRQKKTEFLLSRRGFLPSGWVTVPGPNAGSLGYIDAYGNIKPTTYRQIINVLQLKAGGTARARSISAASQKRAARMGVDVEFFAVAPGANRLGAGGGSLPPGVYRRTGRGGREVHRILKFIRSASYRPRLDMNAIANGTVGEALQEEFKKAFASVRARFSAREGRR